MGQFGTGCIIQRLRALERDRRGGIAIGAAAGAFMMTGLAALVIDVSTVYTEQNHLQTVADLAALGAAQELPNAAAARTRAAMMIDTGLECHKRRRGPAEPASESARENVADRRPDKKGSDCGDYSASIDADSVVLGHWNAATGRVEPDDQNPSVIEVVLQRNDQLDNAVPTTFARLLGVDMIDVTARAVAERGNGRHLELAMALDVSKSMDGFKIGRLREISIGLVDQLFGRADVRDDLWVAVVPFAGRVNITDVGRAWLTEAPAPGQSFCAAMRPSDLTTPDDRPPTAEGFPLHRESPVHFDICPRSTVSGLSGDKRAVIDQLERLSTQYGTSTQIGAAWAWRALSPRWRGLWADAELPHESGPDQPHKAMILMTDGENRPDVNRDPFNAAAADAQLEVICSGAKAAGIEVFTVTFEAPTSINNLYRRCASTADHFFEARNTAELAGAFGQIGGLLAGKPRLIR